MNITPLRPAPFKPARELTCPHGRFWLSCPRCRALNDLRPPLAGLQEGGIECLKSMVRGMSTASSSTR